MRQVLLLALFWSSLAPLAFKTRPLGETPGGGVWMARAGFMAQGANITGLRQQGEVGILSSLNQRRTRTVDIPPPDALTVGRDSHEWHNW